MHFSLPRITMTERVNNIALTNVGAHFEVPSQGISHKGMDADSSTPCYKIGFNMHCAQTVCPAEL